MSAACCCARWNHSESSTSDPSTARAARRMPNGMSRSLLGLQSALVVVLSALGFAMAVWVYRANPRKRENQGFSLMVLAIVAWVSCYHMAQFGDPIFWFWFAAFAVIMFFVTYYFFIVEWFLGKSGLLYRLF